MEEKVFLYTVHPRRPIINLSNVDCIRVPKTVPLTLKDVYKCLDKATLYRRFNDSNVRVTKANADRLHNENLISEADWANINDTKAVEKKVETPVEKSTEKVEEKVSEAAPETVTENRFSVNSVDAEEKSTTSVEGQDEVAVEASEESEDVQEDDNTEAQKEVSVESTENKQNKFYKNNNYKFQKHSKK
jgi:hypothetical protein